MGAFLSLAFLAAVLRISVPYVLAALRRLNDEGKKDS